MDVQQHNKVLFLVSLKDHPRVRSCGGCLCQFMKSYPPTDDIAVAHKEYGSWRDAQTRGMHKPEYYEDQTILPIGITTRIVTVFVKATTAPIRTFNLLT